MNNIFRLLTEHLIPSGLIGLIALLIFNDPVLLLVALLTGWLIDTDHIIDYCYYLYKKNKKGFNHSIILTGEYFKINNKVFVPLHSWELIIIWVIYWVSLGNVDIAIVGALSWGVHLFQDQFIYKVRYMGYFFLYRLKRDFSLHRFCYK